MRKQLSPGSRQEGPGLPDLLPDRLKRLWARVDAGLLTPTSAFEEQERLLDEHRVVWTRALLREGQADLKQSLLGELAEYLGEDDVSALEQRCRNVGTQLKDDWHRTVEPGDRSSIERFYDASQGYLFDLTWWHTLEDDRSPLAYVLALEFARRQPGRRYLDFGAGIGSGAILFARHGFDVGIADISSTLLRVCEWRLGRRGLSSTVVDLKVDALPSGAFDFITAMDVFEHLAEPVEAVEQLAAALSAGGHLFGRFAAEPDPERPQHIVFDFQPTLRRLSELGFTEVWRDEWLWGHRVFRKPR